MPNDPAFQKRVLTAALNLLPFQQEGPILVDFPEEAPSASETATGWACPINFSRHREELDGIHQQLDMFKDEISKLRPWYDLGLKKRGRTTVGLSSLDIDALCDFIGSFLRNVTPDNPSKEIPLGEMLRFAAEDLKSFYYEAATAQPGAKAPDSTELTDWFWEQTVAAQVLHAVKNACMSSDDDDLQMAASMFLIPMDRM